MINNIIIGIFTSALGFIFIFSNASFARSQEYGGAEFTLEEITVTAQKREEKQQKVAITMDVISSEEITELGKNNIDGVLSSVSGAVVQKAADGYRVSIRGISDTSETKMGQSTASPTVALNLDGVYTNRKDTGSGFYDIERVEVLYGPQSTLYASNSPGGIINIITAQPKTDKFEMSGTLNLGNYSLIHTEGMVNVPINDKMAIRAAFTTSKHGAYLSNGSDDEDSMSGRIKALFKPNDKLSLIATGEITHDGGRGFGGGVEFFYDQDDADDPWTGSDNESNKSNDITSKTLNAQIAWDTSFGSITMLPSYYTREGTRTVIMNGSENYAELDAKTKSFEFRMTSPSDFIFEWIVGATYFNSEDYAFSQEDLYIESGGIEGDMMDRTILSKNKAIYANITYPLIDAFRVTLGYRKSWDKVITDNIEFRENFSGGYELQSSYIIQENPGKADVKIGFEYDLAEDSMLYGDYSTSYHVQGMSHITEYEVPPTKFKDFTLGVKNRFFENRLELNLAAYYYKYLNYEAMDTMSIWLGDYDNDGNYDGDSNEETTDPNSTLIGDGRIMGLDLQTTTLITQRDTLKLSVSYIKSEWTNLVFQYYYGQTWIDDGVDPDTGLHYGHYESIGPLSYNGKPMMNTPPWTINLDYSHYFSLWNGGTLKTGITSKYQTGYRLTWKDSEYPKNWQESFHVEGFNASYFSPDNKWTLSAYVNNIFNYAEKRNYMSGGLEDTLYIGDPRTYGCVFTFKL